MIQVIKVTQVVQVVWVVQVVRVARTTSLDDMHSENIWFSWYKPSKYREKLICHACDRGRTDGRRKVENGAVFCWTRNRNITFKGFKVEIGSYVKHLIGCLLKCESL